MNEFPTYTTPPRRRHDDPDANAAAIIEATRRELTNAALNDAGAAEAALLALVAHAAARWLEPLLSYARALDALAQKDDASDNVLTAAFQEAHGLNNAAAALAAGLPLEAA